MVYMDNVIKLFFGMNLNYLFLGMLGVMSCVIVLN